MARFVSFFFCFFLLSSHFLVFPTQVSSVSFADMAASLYRGECARVLSRSLSGVLRYPERARVRGWEGVCGYELLIAGDGSLVSLRGGGDGYLSRYTAQVIGSCFPLDISLPFLIPSDITVIVSVEVSYFLEGVGLEAR